MELSGILTAAGIVGVTVALGLASLFLVVQPIWSIIDCIESDRESDAKLLVGLALFVTWGLGTLLYGLFFAVSRKLRIFTIVMVVLLFLIGTGGMVACGVGAFHVARTAQEQAEVAERATVHAVESFRPPAISVDAVAPFSAIHFVRRGHGSLAAAVAEHTLAGPVDASLRDISDEIRHIAAADGALFAITAHDFGAVSPTSGRLVKIALDPELEADFAWPKGVAFDAASGRVVVMTSHVYTRFYRYDPRTSAWERLPAGLRDLPLVALAWLPEDSAFYALERSHGSHQLRTVHRFNAAGALLGSVLLDPPIPVLDDATTAYQLHASSGRLVLMLPPAAAARAPGAELRILAIDPKSGAVSAARGSEAVAVAQP